MDYPNSIFIHRYKRKAEVKNHHLSPPNKIRIIEDKFVTDNTIFKNHEIRDKHIHFLQQKFLLFNNRKIEIQNEQKCLLQQKECLQFQRNQKLQRYEYLTENWKTMECLKEKMEISAEISKLEFQIRQIVSQHFIEESNMDRIKEKMQETLDELIIFKKLK